MQYLVESASYYLSNVVTRFIWNFNTMQVLFERKCLQLYNNYSTVRNVTYYCQSIWWRIFSKPQLTLLQEPEESVWITLTTHDDDDIYTSQQYLDNEPTRKLFERKMEASANTLSNLKNKNSCCLIGKYNERYFVQVSDISPKLEYAKSSIMFLSVYYCHPSMKTKLELTIPESMLYVGNELLNGTFLLRALKMQPEPFVFDPRYELQCMDSNVFEFSVFDNQYVRVNHNSFEVVTIFA